jgi:hypothetical protein
MRTEIEKVKLIMVQAAAAAQLYHENIKNVRRVCRPETILQEEKVYTQALEKSMQKAAAAADEALLELRTQLQNAIILRGEDYDASAMAAIKELQPDAAELTTIAQRYVGNETMLRALKKYCTDNKIRADLPNSGESKIQALDLMRGDIGYVISLTGNTDYRQNKYAQTCCRAMRKTLTRCLRTESKSLGTEYRPGI